MRGNLFITLIGAVCAAGLGAAWAWRRHRSTYVEFETMFGRARVYQVEGDDGEPVRLLEVGGIVQSGTYLEERYEELVFEYLKKYNLMFESGRDIQSVCVLGCGGYDYPEHLIAHHPEVVVDAVEIDPAITAIARRYFFLDRLTAEYDIVENGRLNLICADALDHLESSSTQYDAIVNDAFDAGSPPKHLTTPRFYSAVRARLVPDGLFLTNVVSALEGPGSVFLREQVGLLRSLFEHVYVFPCDPDSLQEADNVIIVATDAELPLDIAVHSL